MALGWGVIRTQVAQEDCARRHATNQGYRCFLPKFLTYDVSRGRRRAKVANLFPSYLFIFLEDHWYDIGRLRGVSRVILDGDKPAIVREHEIAYLMERFDEVGSNKLGDGRFKRGQTVRAMSGPMRDQIGKFAEMLPGDRVNVLFEMMGRAVPVQLGERELAAA
jgi:transcriptional antiterminator RfaH